MTKGEYEQWVDVEQPEMMTKIVLEKHFDDLDKDGNGVLDKQDVDMIFYEIDDDSDSVVTEEEYKRWDYFFQYIEVFFLFNISFFLNKIKEKRFKTKSFKIKMYRLQFWNL